MKSAVLLVAMLIATPLPAFAGIAPSTGTSAAVQSGAKVAAPKQNQESQSHENHDSQPENTK